MLITNRREIITPDLMTALGPKPHPVPGAERTVLAGGSLLFLYDVKSSCACRRIMTTCHSRETCSEPTEETGTHNDRGAKYTQIIMTLCVE